MNKCGLISKLESLEKEISRIKSLLAQENNPDNVGDISQTSNKVSYKIYQLPSGEKYHFIRFMDKDFNDKHGVQLNHEDYDLMYEGTLDAGQSLGQTLDGIYTKFNIDSPADFKGHSLSVSDVIVLAQNGEEAAYYVDSFGFTEMPDFSKGKYL